MQPGRRESTWEAGDILGWRVMGSAGAGSKRKGLGKRSEGWEPQMGFMAVGDRIVPATSRAAVGGPLPLPVCCATVVPIMFQKFN